MCPRWLVVMLVACGGAKVYTRASVDEVRRGLASVRGERARDPDAADVELRRLSAISDLDDASRAQIHAEIVATYDVLEARLAREGTQRAPFGHLAFLSAPLDPRPAFVPARAAIAAQLAARVETERDTLPGLAAWDALLARSFGATIPQVDNSISAAVAWNVEEADRCDLIVPGDRDDVGLVAVHATVLVTCTPSQAVAATEHTEYQTVTEQVPETRTLGTRTVSYTTTEDETVVGQEDYDCSSGNTRKVCRRSFERKEPHQVTRQREVTDTQTVMVTRQRQVPHEVKASETVYKLALRGTVKLDWPDGGTSVPIEAAFTSSEPGKNHQLAIDAVAATLERGGRLVLARTIETAGRSDPRRGLDLALRAAFLAHALDAHTTRWLAAREHTDDATIARLFAVQPAAPSAPPADPHPGLTDEEYEWASHLEMRVNRGEKPSAEELRRYGELSDKATAARKPSP